MRQKIHKIQLVTLFGLAFLNLAYFYFKDRLPDNFYEISSANLDIGAIRYYSVSVLAHIGFYTGIWIFAGFIASTLLYSFILTKKKIRWEALISILPLTCTMLVCHLFFPQTLGEGLSYFLNSELSSLGAAFLVVVQVLSLYYLILPQSFMAQVKRISKFRLNVVNFAEVYEKIKSTWPSRVNLRWEKVATLTPQKAKVEKPQAAPKLERQLVAPLPEALIEKESVQEYQDEVDEEDNEEIETDDTCEEELVCDTSSSEISEEETSDIAFFAADELIDCVSTSHRIKAADPDEGYFLHISSIIEDKLKEFGILSHVVNVMKGPVVDTFELNLGAGVKVSSVSNRADDVSLALSGAPIRIVYPMKGKTTVGVEVPRNPRDFIYLDEVLRSKLFRESPYNLPIAMGKDAYGEPSVVDLTSMPHMLVAGTTGSGKSVFINTLLVSLIVKNSPDRLKLILIDPKSVELALFQTLPHLIMPTVTDPGTASISLLWAVEEMERRYILLREAGVRNIDGYNRKIGEADPHLLARIKTRFDDDNEDFRLPFLVIVVDEVADLIQCKHGKEIETNISRLAAKARAAGIHLVLATQRPSTDVITGVIKANFPTRIAFKVITNMDSRVILDTQGAEKLLGKGDMLFKQGVDLIRVHSAYVDETEIERLVDKLGVLPMEYSQAALNFIQTNHLQPGDLGEGMDGHSSSDEAHPEDPLYREAVDIVARTRQASASWLQRRMNVGYNRAAKLVEAMERKGIVGPGNGSKPRQVLIAPPDDVTG